VHRGQKENRGNLKNKKPVQKSLRCPEPVEKAETNF